MGNGPRRCVSRCVNFHGSRVGRTRLLMGNGPICVGKMGQRRRSPCGNRIMSRTSVLHSVRLVGRGGVGDMQASRCPGSPH